MTQWPVSADTPPSVQHVIAAGIEEFEKTLLILRGRNRWEYRTESEWTLPPDLTLTGQGWRAGQSRILCLVMWHGRQCTRRAGHTGRHAAGNGTHIVAVWP
jgi:hypothetical protein